MLNFIEPFEVDVKSFQVIGAAIFVIVGNVIQRAGNILGMYFSLFMKLYNLFVAHVVTYLFVMT